MPSYKCDDCNRVWIFLWNLFDGESKIVGCDTCNNKFRIWKKPEYQYELIDPTTEVIRAFNELTPKQQSTFLEKLRNVNAIH